MKMFLRKSLLLLVFAVILTGCGDQRELIHLNGSTMGTYYSIKLIKQEGLPAASELQAEIDRRLELVNDQMSTYRKQSELSQFNQHTSNQPFEVSADTAKVIAEAIRLAELTDGALDVTVGPVVNLWSFGPEARPEKKHRQLKNSPSAVKSWVFVIYLLMAIRYPRRSRSCMLICRRSPKVLVSMSLPVILMS